MIRGGRQDIFVAGAQTLVDVRRAESLSQGYAVLVFEREDDLL